MSNQDRIVPAPIDPAADGREQLNAWGFDDAGFALTEDGEVIMRGKRYALCGKPLPSLIPWISRILEVDLPLDEEHRSEYPGKLPDRVEHRSFVEAISGFLRADQISTDDEQRLRHGHGHTLEEMWTVNYGAFRRLPDIVLFPERADEAQAIVADAVRHNVVIIPYGGGTNVSEALLCPDGERRMIASVDMSRMCSVRWIDPVNHTACIEAGAIGRHIFSTLAEHGFTLGHEPDSVEFSTLGGWIATNASGMKKNRYGNIEDIVEDVTAVTADGVLRRMNTGPRESVGADLRNLLFGSEGNYALITDAVVRIFPVPAERRFDSILFRDFEIGIAFMYELTRAKLQPASVRLVDNMQFQFSQALKPATSGLKRLKSRFQKWLITKAYRFDPSHMVACTLVYEGDPKEITHHQRRVATLIRKHRGVVSGAENGKRGYAMTFAIAYIRDFVLKHHVVAESFETSVPWDRLSELCRSVIDRVRREHRERSLPGKPYVTCRVTQVYPSGACVYFYLAFYSKGIAEPHKVFAELEQAARDEVLNCGGTLSHHHGIGKIRAPFVHRIFSPEYIAASARIKKALDPDNIFAANNAIAEPH